VKEEPEAAPDQEIVREILRYLEHHPGAKDTLDGIAHWWLRRERNAKLLQDVERAVALLLAQGILLETRRSGVPPYYGRNPQKDEERSSEHLKGS
jgi:hypothetical protein